MYLSLNEVYEAIDWEGDDMEFTARKILYSDVAKLLIYDSSSLTLVSKEISERMASISSVISWR